MPELSDDATAFCMYSLGHFFPGLQLLLTIEAGNVRVALSLCTDGRAFADQQTCRGALCVVGLHCLCGHRLGRPVTRQWRHGNAVGQAQATGFNRIKQRGHARLQMKKAREIIELFCEQMQKTYLIRPSAFMAACTDGRARMLSR